MDLEMLRASLQERGVFNPSTLDLATTWLDLQKGDRSHLYAAVTAGLVLGVEHTTALTLEEKYLLGELEKVHTSKRFFSGSFSKNLSTMSEGALNPTCECDSGVASGPSSVVTVAKDSKEAGETPPAPNKKATRNKAQKAKRVRRVSGYVVFCDKQGSNICQRLAEKDPNLLKGPKSMITKNKAYSEAWKALTPEEQQVYKSQAAEINEALPIPPKKTARKRKTIDSGEEVATPANEAQEAEGKAEESPPAKVAKKKKKKKKKANSGVPPGERKRSKKKQPAEVPKPDN